MISEDSAFIFCINCRRSFYIELVDEEETPPIPAFCPFCGAIHLDDLEEHLEDLNNTIAAEVRRYRLAVIQGGKSQQKVEDQNEPRRTNLSDSVQSERDRQEDE